MNPEAAGRNRYMLLNVAISLVAAGLVVLSSASGPRALVLFGDPHFFLKRQLVWLALAAPAAVAAAFFDYHRWRRLAPLLVAVNLVLLVLVLVAGPEIGGSRRWLRLGFAGFQPSELAKFTTVLMIAAWISAVPVRAGWLKDDFLRPACALGCFVLLILLEPDVGTAALIGVSGGLLLFLGGTRVRPLIASAALGSLSFFLYVRLDPLRWRRILAWLWPDLYPEIAYQYLEARKAFLLGGTRINLGGSIQKQFYLPEVHTDFIFAVLGEEMGIWGTFAVLLAFTLFFLCGLLIALHAKDGFGRLLAVGLTNVITIQALFNLCVVTGLLPTKGISLPFFSYGGSGLLMALCEVGVLLNIARRSDSASWSEGG